MGLSYSYSPQLGDDANEGECHDDNGGNEPPKEKEECEPTLLERNSWRPIAKPFASLIWKTSEEPGGQKTELNVTTAPKEAATSEQSAITPQNRATSPQHCKEKQRKYVLQDIPVESQFGGAQDTPHMIENSTSNFESPGNESAKSYVPLDSRLTDARITPPPPERLTSSFAARDTTEPCSRRLSTRPSIVEAQDFFDDSSEEENNDKAVNTVGAGQSLLDSLSGRLSASSASSQASFQSTQAKRGSIALESLSTSRNTSCSYNSGRSSAFHTPNTFHSPMLTPNLSESDSDSDDSFASGGEVCDFADEIQASAEELEQVPALYMSPSISVRDEEEENVPEEVRLRRALQKAQDLHFGLQTEEAQDLMVASLIPQIFQPGGTIVQEGERSEEFYFIIGPKGAEVEVFAKEKSLCRLGVGKYFGERTLVYGHGRSRNATIKAAMDCPPIEVVSIRPESFSYWQDFRRYLLIRQVPFLLKLPTDEQRHISQMLHYETFHSGDFIVKQGDRGDKFYMIINGEAKVLQDFEIVKGGEKQPPRLITSLYEGNFFGELALLLDQPRNASVVAQGIVNCVYITKDDFRKALSASNFQRFMEKHSGSLLKKIEQRMGMHRQSTRRYSSTRKHRRSSAEMARESFVSTSHLVKRRLSTGEQYINNYKVLGQLGKGQFGTVYKVAHKETNEIYAMKAMDLKKDIIVESSRREIAVMKKLRHRNLVAVWEAIEDPRASQVYIIQEFVHQGPIMTESFNCDAISTEKCRRYFRDLMNGLAYLHSYNVVHGDIKPANLLLAADNTVKIADFGSAIMRESQEAEESANKYATSLFGTPAYMPPELFFVEREKVKEVLKTWTDLWSVGVTLFQMITGFLPFSAGNEIELAHKVMHLQPEFPEDLAWEPSLRNLVNRLLEKDANSRITMNEILEHEWVTYDGLEPMESFDEIFTMEVTQSDIHEAISQDTRDAEKITRSTPPIVESALNESES